MSERQGTGLSFHLLATMSLMSCQQRRAEFGSENETKKKSIDLLKLRRYGSLVRLLIIHRIQYRRLALCFYVPFPPTVLTDLSL